MNQDAEVNQDAQGTQIGAAANAGAIRLILCDINVDVVEAWRAAFADRPEVEVRWSDLADAEADAYAVPTSAYGALSVRLLEALNARLGMGLETRIVRAIMMAGGRVAAGSALVLETENDAVPYLIIAPTVIADAQTAPDDENSPYVQDGSEITAQLSAQRADNKTGVKANDITDTQAAPNSDAKTDAGEDVTRTDQADTADWESVALNPAAYALRAALNAARVFVHAGQGAIRSIACPGFGTGMGWMPPVLAARQMRQAYEEYVTALNEAARQAGA